MATPSESKFDQALRVFGMGKRISVKPQSSLKDPHLCTMCKSLDFSQFTAHYHVHQYRDPEHHDFTEVTPTNHKLLYKDGTWSEKAIDICNEEKFKDKNLGLWCEILSRATWCSFCSFIVGMVDLHTGGKSTEFDRTGDSLRCYLDTAQICTIYLSDGSRARDFGMSRLSIKLASPERRFPWYQSSKTVFEAGDCVRFAYTPQTPRLHRLSSGLTVKVPSFNGRLRPTFCDVALFRGWLRQCITEHLECNPSGMSKLPAPFRLINVRKRCITTYPTGSKPPSYGALSYVWGKNRQCVILSRANLQKLHLRNSLCNAPRTIDDAMKVVDMLGYQYLWVDALCIIQDDMDDKLVQLPRMSSIYSMAILTIIAAFGNSVEAGLPGIVTGRPPEVLAHLGDFTVYGNTTKLDLTQGAPIEATFWNTRGWTLQERLLSKRCLIFTQEQVYWNCTKRHCCEEFELESQTVQVLYTQRPNNAKQQRANLEHMDMYNWNFVRNLGLSVRNFGNLAEQYTRRQLTYRNDILNAFNAVLESIPDEFFWAIPLSKFGRYICWTWSDLSSVAWTWRNLQDAPSWSWVAWVGPITFNYKEGSPVSIVTYYRRKDDNLQVIHRAESSLENAVFALNLSNIPPLVNLTQNHLIFQTSCAELQVFRNPYRFLGDRSPDYILYPHPDVSGRNYYVPSGIEICCFNMCLAAHRRDFREGSLYEFALMATLGSHYIAMMLSQREGVYYRMCTKGGSSKSTATPL